MLAARIMRLSTLVWHCTLGAFILGLSLVQATGVYHPYGVGAFFLIAFLIFLVHVPALYFVLKAKPVILSTWVVILTEVLVCFVVAILGLRGLSLVCVSVAAMWIGILIAGRIVANIPLPNICRNCQYSLHGNTSGICPECGTKIAVS